MRYHTVDALHQAAGTPAAPQDAGHTCYGLLKRRILVIADLSHQPPTASGTRRRILARQQLRPPPQVLKAECIPFQFVAQRRLQQLSFNPLQERETLGPFEESDGFSPSVTLQAR